MVFNPFRDWRENIYLIFFKNIKVKYVSLFEKKVKDDFQEPISNQELHDFYHPLQQFWS
jgi:hypothetical protein